MLATQAPAKVNWTLEVLGRRDDGYHEIASVMSTISLCDELTLVPDHRWRVSVTGPPRLQAELESGGNSVEEALRILRNAVGDRFGPAWLHLVKRIPAAAGLGGGSSDAAAALRLVASQWARDGGWAFLPELRHLPEIAAAIGSDVPFFLDGGTQLVRGRGETVTELPRRRRAWLVLFTPPIEVERKTALLYRLISPASYTDGSRSHALAVRLKHHRGGITDEDLCNVFEAVAEDAFPGLERYRSVLSDATGNPVHLCGAGPSLFALMPDRAAAERAAEKLRSDGHAAWAVRTLSADEATQIVER